MVSEGNKRIAKNTLFLYIRMLFIMGVNLYTVRIVLNVLGIEDYGIYNVVGGVVTMFSFISNTMASACQRFFAFELGKQDFHRLNEIFSLSIIIFIGIVVIILLLAETLGLWFINTQLNIPEERMSANNWVYQFAIFSFIITVLNIPFIAVIIARESMNLYAYVSIVEVVLKLIMVFFLTMFSVDKLKLYSVLLFITTFLTTMMYRVYCKKKFEECNFRFFWDTRMFKQILSFSGWTLFGTIAGVSCNQGINILLNIYFGPVINAARAIAYQVSAALSSFASTFYTAVKPQIVKSYAVGDKKRLIKLIFQSSKFSYFLLLILCLPVYLETSYLLTLWLKESTDFMVIFTRLVIIYTLVNSLQNPLTTSVHATGKIKKYHLYVESITLLSLPISYLCLKLGYKPQSTMFVLIIVFTIAHFIRVWIVHSQVGMSVIDYTKKVLFTISCVSFISSVPPLFLSLKMEPSLLRFVLTVISSFFSVVITTYAIGISKEDRLLVLRLIKNPRQSVLSIYRMKESD